MTAADVLRQCARAGVLVSVDDGRLHVRREDGSPIPPALLAALREHKAELLTLLAGRPQPRRGHCWTCGGPVLGWPDALYANCATCAGAAAQRVLARLRGAAGRETLEVEHGLAQKSGPGEEQCERERAAPAEPGTRSRRAAGRGPGREEECMMLSSRRTVLDEVGDPNAPLGSRPWAIALRDAMSMALKDERFAARRLRNLLRILMEHQAFEILTDRDGKPFPTLEAFCRAPEPYGLGYDLDAINAIIAEWRRKDHERG